jgi:hypothetical protein
VGKGRNRALLGESSSTPAVNAAAIKTANPTAPDGLYWISDSWTGNVATQVYCDMTIDGGGWMLWACKVTNTHNPLISTISSTAWTSTTSNTTGYVPTTSWSKVLWRFNDKVGKPYGTIYTRANDTGVNAAAFQAVVHSGTNYINAANVQGWTRSTNLTTFSSITLSSAGMFTSAGFSEEHGSGTDIILDTWASSPDSAANYLFTDNVAVNGMKCVAGYCYENEPILYMWK